MARRRYPLSLALGFRHLIDRPGHAGGDAEDVASRARGERAPVIETADARGHQPIEQVLIAELRRWLIFDLPMARISDHDDALADCWRDPDIPGLLGQ